MRRANRLVALPAAALAALAALWLVGGWFLPGPLQADRAFVVAPGESLNAVAAKLERDGALSSATLFRVRVKLLGGDEPVKAGRFLLPKGASQRILIGILQGSRIQRRFVTIPEGMASIMVRDRLMATPGLTGDIPVPAEGSILPDTYEISPGESRAALVARMQAAMTKALADLWSVRAADTYAQTPEQALILASIIEKETGKASERHLIAGLYTQRLRIGMRLQADPTVIYPITKGKPLGRRIRKSELRAKNDYNTYAMAGLPKGPITNPGKASIEAALNPAKTNYLYFVADGKGGHVFAATLEAHNANVRRWYALRRARGEM